MQRRGYLVNVDALDAFFILIVLYGEGDGAEGNCLALEPSYALEWEDSVGVTAQPFVLAQDISRRNQIRQRQTMVNLPEMLRIVKSAETAMWDEREVVVHNGQFA
jgi:hypothetical protein